MAGTARTTQRLNTAILDRVMELVLAESRGQVVELGAGDGTLAARLVRHGFEVRAVDRQTQNFLPAGIELDVADLNGPLPYADGSFDGAVSTEVIEHLENPWAFLRELHRVVRPGGFVVLSSPNVESAFVRAYFLLTGRLLNFMQVSYETIGHITPVYGWNLERMAEGMFRVEEVTYNANWIPKTPLVLPGRGRLLGQCFVARLRRNDEPPTPQGRRWEYGGIRSAAEPT